MLLTDDEYVLLEKINLYSDHNRRTDRLAACMRQFGSKWNNSHTSFTGLALRSKGLVSTYKDDDQFARWDITPVGKANLLEETNRRRTPVKAAPPVQWAVFSEADSGFQRCTSKEEAEKLARKWVLDTEEDAVHIIQIHKTLKSKVVVEEV